MIITEYLPTQLIFNQIKTKFTTFSITNQFDVLFALLGIDKVRHTRLCAIGL